MSLITQQGTKPATLDGDAAKESVLNNYGDNSKGSANNATLDSNNTGTGDGVTGGVGGLSVADYEIVTNENDRDSDGWPNDIEGLLGTDPDNFNSKPDGTYDPNFDYSAIYEAPVVENKVEDKSPNDIDLCALTEQEIKDYQDQIQSINNILSGVKSPGGGFPPTDLLNHPNREVEPLKTYIDRLIDKRAALTECLTLSIKTSCLGEKSQKYSDQKAQEALIDPDIPSVSSLEYERPEPDEATQGDVIVEQQPVVDDADPPPSEELAQSEPAQTPTPQSASPQSASPQTGAPQSASPQSGSPQASTPQTGDSDNPVMPAPPPPDYQDDNDVVLEEDPEEAPIEETEAPPTQRSETVFYQIVDDSVRIVASIEFKALLGSNFTSPLTSGIIQAGEEMLTTPAAKLLEIQAIVRQLTHYNVKNLFEVFTNGKLSSVFRLMYKLYEDSNGELFLQTPIPSSIDDVYNNINTYLEEIASKEINNTELTLSSEINLMISHTINDGNSILEIGKNYACAVIYYFILYVRCLQSLKVATEENVTGPQSIASPEDGVSSFIQNDTSQNLLLDSLLNRDISLGLDVDTMNSLLTNKNIVRDDLAFSVNLTRIFKAILITGLGLDPTITLDSSNPSSSKMKDANEDLIQIIKNELTIGSHDIQSATVLFPSNSESVGQGIGNARVFTHNYYNLQENDEVSEQSLPLIYDTRRIFATGNSKSSYLNIVDARRVSNIKKLCAFVMAERGLAKSLSEVSNYSNLVNISNSDSELKLSLKNVIRTYHTENPQFLLGEFEEFYFNEPDRNDNVYNKPGRLILSSKNAFESTNYLRGIRLLDNMYNKFHTYMTNSEIVAGKVSAGVQSSNTAFDVPNEVLIGRSVTGLLFETNYYNNEQTEASFSPEAQLNIFDDRNSLPSPEYVDQSGQLDLNNLPFRFSGEYYGQGPQMLEDGSVPYLDMLKSLRKYLNSVIDTSYHLFNRDTSDISNPQARIDIIEDFFEELGSFFWNEMGSLEQNAETPGQNAMLLNILAYCGSHNDTAQHKEEMYRRAFFVLSADFAEYLGNRYTSPVAGQLFHDPAVVLKGDISIHADRRKQDDIGELIGLNNFGFARPSIKDRLFGMWLKYCAPAGGLNKIFDLMNDGLNGDTPSGADIAIEDYELTGNSGNQELGFGGGIFLRSDGEFIVASRLAAGAGGGGEVKYSTKHGGSDGLRNLLYTDIPNDSKINSQIYHSEDIKTAGGYKRSVKDIPGEPDFFTDTRIGKGFNSTFRHLECKLTELLFKYADTFQNNFANEGSTKDIDFGTGGYDPLNNSNVFGSSSMFNKSEVNDYDDILGAGTNKFTCLLLFYSIVARIAVWFPTDVIIEKGTSRGRDNDKNKRRFFGPRWSARYAYVISNALRGRDIDAGITGFNTANYPNLQEHYDAVKEIREAIIDYLKEIQNTQVSCLKFLDTICQKLTEEIQLLETSNIPNLSEIASTPESDDIHTEHGDLMNLQFSAEQQKKLTTSLAIKLMTPSAAFNNYYLPSSKDVTPHQVAKMMKFFSQSGRNYLTNEISMGDSTKNRSNKLIFSVGIPNGLIGKVMLESQDVQNLGYNSVMPKSNSLIKMNIHKINMLNPEDVKYIPKSYYFDTAKFVFNNSIILPDDPLRDFDPTGMLTQLSDDKFIDLSRLYHIGRDETGSMRIAYINGYTMKSLGQALVDAGGEYQKKDIAESLLMNHLTDYYLKVYMKVMTGIDVDEDIYSFSSKKDITLYAGNDPENENFFMKNFYSKMTTILNAMESSNHSDPSYLYEFNRLVNVARRSNMFAQKKYFNRTILPKTFDRVFSVLIDEGDFIPVAAYDQKNNQINTQNGFGEAAKQNAINAFQNFSDAQQKIIPAVDGSGHTLNSSPDDFNTIIGQAIVIDDNDLTDETIYQYYCTIEAVASEDYNLIKELARENQIIPASESNELEYLAGVFGPGSDVEVDTSLYEGSVDSLNNENTALNLGVYNTVRD